jgi:hypothetical protein
MDKMLKPRVVLGFLGFVLFLAAWNLPPLKIIPVLLGLEPVMHHYEYVTADGSYSNFEVPEKGRDIGMVERQFEDYRSRSGDPDLVLYRTSKRQWWRFWMWSDYATNDRWDLPFMERTKETER